MIAALSLSALLSGCLDFTDSSKTDGLTDTAPDTDSGSDTDRDTGPEVVPPDALAGHVVILVLDGGRIDETFGDEINPDSYSTASSAKTSTLFTNIKKYLVPNGTLIVPGYNTGITITGPGHCNLLTGIHQEFGHFATPDGPGFYRPELPTMYEEFRKQFTAAKSGDLVLTGNTDHIASLNYSLYPGDGSTSAATYTLVADPGDPQDTEPAANDGQVLTALESTLRGSAPRLALANLHAMDRAGHYNSDPNAYGERVAQMDQPIVDLWDLIQSGEYPGMKDDTVLVVVADHGRHRWGDEAASRLDGTKAVNSDGTVGPDYRNHGDQCRGCREIPILMVGKGIKQGVTVTSPYTQEDLTATIARILGVTVPYSTGMVIQEALDGTPTVTNRTGDVNPATANGAVATEEFTTDDAAQSVVVVDGAQVSTVGAIHAEAPAMYSDGSRDVVCWRELNLLLDQPDAIDWPWAGMCKTRLDAGSWDDLTLPNTVVSPLWRPSMASDDSGHLMFTFADNSDATTYFNASNPASIRLWRWSTDAGWEGTEYTGPDNTSIFPGNPTITEIGANSYIAYANSDLGAKNSTNPGRYTRHISLQSVSWGNKQTWQEVWRTYTEACPGDTADTDGDGYAGVRGDGEVGCPVGTPTVDTEGNQYGRFEHPAVTAVDKTIYVAYVGYGDVGNTLLLSTGLLKGASWDSPQRLDTAGRVLGHIPPIWVDGTLYWAELNDTDTVSICRFVPDGTPDCTDTLAPRIRGLAGSSPGIVASLDQGTAEWTVTDITW